MSRLLIVFLSVMLSSVVAQADHHIPNLGEKATEFKDEGKEAHKRDGMSHAASLILQRKMHPELLSHKRDKTLRQGVRGGVVQLSKCVECHTSVDKDGEFIPVNAPDQFCSTCHKKVGTSLDCFSCHRTTPAEEM
ncbi:MAG: cytochrome c3 family protein [Candidatus Thioglobus sp.]|uniref:cytochrome c3 family protein n=1 Tax=Candidatus Thioglobus sp. TaxID=2026721 RepID=UPI0026156153|nr:cytochrome c3 family protein [Candidatus Thioglobus sp.]MDC9726230.1 cytochrome c3 family protein [Candidatus Thioglobus sp.]